MKGCPKFRKFQIEGPFQECSLLSLKYDVVCLGVFMPNHTASSSRTNIFIVTAVRP